MITARTALGLALGCGAASLIATRVQRSARAIDFAGKTVVIVGGSRGLGLVMARELGVEGAQLVLVARDAGELGRAQSDLQQRGIQATTNISSIGGRLPSHISSRTARASSR